MAELKTKKTDASVPEFIANLPDERTRQDATTLVDLMRQATKQPPKLWGGRIVGFGDFHYISDSGREGDWFIMGFAPGKSKLTLYGMGHWRTSPALKDLGKYKLGGGCLYINKLDDVSVPQLRKLLGQEFQTAIKLEKEMSRKKADKEKAKTAKKAGSAKSATSKKSSPTKSKK